MEKWLLVTMLMLALPGCTATTGWSLFPQAGTTTSAAEPAHYDFAWRLSGDRAVAPAQVFDDGRQMWLQFAPEQAVPAIFERTTHGDRPLRFRRDGPYVIVRGVWPRLVLRGGHLIAFVERLHEPAAHPPASTPLVDSPSVPVLSSGVDEPSLPAFSDSRFSFTAAAAPVAEPASIEAPVAASVEPSPLATMSYEVGPLDKNLRVALSRWAGLAGWVFEPEHWAVDADIPIIGSASFDSEFKVAVRDLVGSTELADRPLQPCFYSNRVLRIVPYAQSCDRTAGAGLS